MNVFDIIGPVMIGPSSSHTAGAARIGKFARTILGEKPVLAEILLSGSFAKTYKGHGTDKALIAGILGMTPDDPRIRTSPEIAEEEGLSVHFTPGEIEDAHPNTVLITLTGEEGKSISVQGASVGGGNILINQINGMVVDISGDSMALIVTHRDVPGMIADVTNILARRSVNICGFKLRRNEKGGIAVMVIEIDGDCGDDVNEIIKRFPNIIDSTMIRPN